MINTSQRSFLSRRDLLMGSDWSSSLQWYGFRSVREQRAALVGYHHARIYGRSRAWVTTGPEETQTSGWRLFSSRWHRNNQEKVSKFSGYWKGQRERIEHTTVINKRRTRSKALCCFHVRCLSAKTWVSLTNLMQFNSRPKQIHCIYGLECFSVQTCLSCI